MFFAMKGKGKMMFQVSGADELDERNFCGNVASRL
jgi:hypothetical protein